MSFETYVILRKTGKLEEGKDIKPQCLILNFDAYEFKSAFKNKSCLNRFYLNVSSFEHTEN